MIKPIEDFRSSQTDRLLINNSLTVRMFDVVVPIASGTVTIVTNASGSTAGDVYDYGVVVGFSKKNGEVYPATGLDPSNSPPRITVDSDNTTDTSKQVHAVVLPITSQMKFEMDTDAATETTAGSSEPLKYFILADCRTVDESSVVTPAATAVTNILQILSFGVHPLSTSKIIGKFAKSLLENSQ